MATSTDAPVTVEYYYKVKWGHQEEFIELFRRNHYPILAEQVKSGRLLKFEAWEPRFHGEGRSDWTFMTVMFATSLLVIIVLLKIFKKDDLEYWSTLVPYIDTFVTSVFIVGMWMMARKKIENWILWIIGDAISIPLFIYKGLAFSGFQFMIFLVLAVMGYVSWRKTLKEFEVRGSKFKV